MTRRDRIFISYRRSDSAGHAGRLEDELGRLLGDRLFMDVSDIAPGVEFEAVLRAELASCGAVLAVIGPRWLDALTAPRDGPDYVRLELALALAQAGVQVVPVLIQGAGLPAEAALPAELRPLVKRQTAALRDERWKDDVIHLAGALRAALRLRRFGPRSMAGLVGAGVVAAGLALWIVQNREPAPAAFSRSRVHEITVAATAKAAKACKPAADQAGECPLVFQLVPDGSTRHVYFDSGSCILKAPPFGDCVLEKLAGVRVPPFNDASEAEVSLNLQVAAGGAVAVTPEQ